MTIHAPAVLSAEAESLIARFTAGWQAGSRPDPADILTECPPAERTAVLRKLVHVELEFRMKAGEPARIEEYLARFPELAADPTTTAGPGTDGDGVVVGNLATSEDRTVPAPVTAAQVVSAYEIVGELGRGGMSVVYEARDTAFDRQVAVKVMNPGQNAVRFVVESKVTARLPHPGIPPVYALGTLPDGRPFLAMKLIKGRTLTNELRAAGLADLPRLLGIFEQICQTIGFAHSRGIIHRDLNPSNIMVGPFGEVQVMNWGLAREVRSSEFGVRSLQEVRSSECGVRSEKPKTPEAGFGFHSALRAPNSELSQPGQVEGTPAYMAPEQARGEPVDARADVFALGGILAVTLGGKPPFTGSTALETVQKAANAELDECLAELEMCGADAELVAVAKRCLAADSADRFADGAAVGKAVSAYHAGVERRLRAAERDRAAAQAKATEAVNTRREAEARLAEQAKRRRMQLPLVGALLLIVSGLGGFAWYRDHAASERKLEEQEAEGMRLRIEARAQTAQAQALAEQARAHAKQREEETRIKVEQARKGIDADLKLAADLRAQHKFRPAEAALGQAIELARRGAPERLPEVVQAGDDLAFVVLLDDIRFRKWVWIVGGGTKGKGTFNTRIAAPEYRKAFLGQGVDPLASDPTETVKWIAASAVRGELVAALDDWALYEPDPTVRDRLLEVARRADPGPWTDRLRDPAVWADRDALAKLAADPGVATAPPAALGTLAELMWRRGLNPAPLLTAARTRHPTDSGLAFFLGQSYQAHGKDGQEIGPYEAARALRPENATIWNNLAGALHARGDLDGAAVAYERAIALGGKDATIHTNLGTVLRDKGDLDGAITAYNRAIAIDPGYAQAHCNLGMVYGDQKKYTEAIASARAAIEADPKLASAHALLGDLLRITGDVPGARAALTEAARLDKTWAPILAQLPGATPAPPPREK